MRRVRNIINFTDVVHKATEPGKGSNPIDQESGEWTSKTNSDQIDVQDHWNHFLPRKYTGIPQVSMKKKTVVYNIVNIYLELSTSRTDYTILTITIHNIRDWFKHACTRKCILQWTFSSWYESSQSHVYFRSWING